MRVPVLFGLVLTACQTATEPDLGGMPLHGVTISGDLALAGHADLTGDSLRVILTVENRGMTGGMLSYGWCSFAVRAVGRDGQVRDSRLGDGDVCPEVLLNLSVPPNQTRDLVVWRLARAWGTLPPPGPYQVTIFYRDAHSRRLRWLPAGEVTVPAG